MPRPRGGGLGTAAGVAVKPKIKVIKPKPVPNTAPVRALRKSVKTEARKVRAGTSKIPDAVGPNLNLAQTVQAAAHAGDAKATKRKQALAKNGKYTDASGAVRQAGFIPDVLGGLGNAVKDVVTLPKTVIQSGYQVGAAGVEAATGDTKRARNLISSVKEHDPIALAVQGRFGKSLDEIHAHPGLSALELYGVKGGVGKGITKAERAVGKNPTLRAPAHFPNSPITQRRVHSEDAFQRGIDKVREKQKIDKADAMRAEADHLERQDAGAHGSRITELRAKANQKDPRILSGAHVKVRAARSASTGRTVSEANQAATSRAVRSAIKPATGRRAKPTAAHTLAAQAIVKSGSRDELIAYRKQLSKAYKGLSHAEQVANRRHQEQIDKALKADVPAAEVAKGVAGYKAVADPLQAKLVTEGILPAERAAKAKLVPYAVQHMEGVTPGLRGPVRSELKATKPYPKASADTAGAARIGADAADRLAEANARFDRVESEMKAVNERFRKRGVPFREGNATFDRLMADMDKAWMDGLAAQGVKTAAHDKARPSLNAGRYEAVPVGADEIRAHMAANDVAEPAYVSQKPNARAGARGPLAPPSISSTARTGKSTTIGAFDASPDVLPKTAANMQRLVDLAANYKSHLDEFAHTPSRGKLTRDEAHKLADELAARDGVKYTVVPDEPFRGDASLGNTLDGAPNSPDTLKAVSEALQHAYSGKADKTGKYSIIPSAAADELKAQAAITAPKGAIDATMRGISSNFRRTVLATSPSWFTGNAVEGALRSVIGGVQPGDKALFTRTLAELEKSNPRVAAELKARVAGGGHYHSADRAQRGSLLQQYDNTRIEPMAKALQRFWAHPAPDAAAAIWDKWTHLVFNQLSGRMESSIQSSMAGAALRKGGLIERGTQRLSADAVSQAARGLTNTNEQAALGEAVARMYGRYDGFTADARHHITTYTPFAAWTSNAANFVLHVLPKDHPTAVALIAAQEKATRNMRQDAGEDLLPPWLQGAIPLSGGRHLRLSKYTPFAAFNDPLDTAAGAVLPQFSGVLAAFNGEDWKGKKLYKDGKQIQSGEKAKVAAQAFGEATVPVFGIIKRLATKGPGSLNPVKPIGPPPAKATVGRSRAKSNPDLILGGGSPTGPDNLILPGDSSSGGDNLILGSP